MPTPVFIDRIMETTTTVGTGSISLAGAMTGYNTFASRYSNGDTVNYCIWGGAEFETGLGVFSSAGPSLSRVTIFQSSNPGNTAVSFSAGTKRVFTTYSGNVLADLRPVGAGSVLVANATNWIGVTISGDGSIVPSGAFTVTGLNGEAVVGAAPVAGNRLYTITTPPGATTMQWSALNLAGGANYVTGVLPLGNMDAQTPNLGGVLGGNSAASTFALGAQSMLLRKAAYIAVPYGSGLTTRMTWGGLLNNSSSGAETGNTPTSGNLASRLKRFSCASSAGTNNVCGWRSSDLSFSAGSGTQGDGSGFYWICRWVEADPATVAGRRAFYGFWDQGSTVGGNVDPSTLANCVGVAQLAADATQWYWCHGGSAAQATVGLGAGLGAPGFANPQNVWQLEIYAPSAEANKFYLRMTNLITGASVSTSFSGTAVQVPQSTTFLSFRLWVCNNNATLTTAISFVDCVAEVDF